MSFILCKPWIWSYKSRHAVRRLECEMEHSGNVSEALCARVCVYNSSALPWDRCSSWDTTISVIAQPAFYYHLVPSQSHPDTGKQVEENNHQSPCALRPDSCQLHTHKKWTSSTKSRVYFWRTILFFQACFCHYHSWSSSCLKSAGCRTAQRSLCTEWDGYKEMMEKPGAVIGAELVPKRCKKKQKKEKRRRELERRGQQQWQWELSDLISLTGPQLCLISFHFHFLVLSDQSV